MYARVDRPDFKLYYLGQRWHSRDYCQGFESISELPRGAFQVSTFRWPVGVETLPRAAWVARWSLGNPSASARMDSSPAITGRKERATSRRNGGFVECACTASGPVGRRRERSQTEGEISGPASAADWVHNPYQRSLGRHEGHRCRDRSLGVRGYYLSTMDINIRRKTAVVSHCFTLCWNCAFRQWYGRQPIIRWSPWCADDADRDGVWNLGSAMGWTLQLLVHRGKSCYRFHGYRHIYYIGFLVVVFRCLRALTKKPLPCFLLPHRFQLFLRTRLCGKKSWKCARGYPWKASNLSAILSLETSPFYDSFCMKSRSRLCLVHSFPSQSFYALGCHWRLAIASIPLYFLIPPYIYIYEQQNLEWWTRCLLRIGGANDRGSVGVGGAVDRAINLLLRWI